MYVDRFTDPIQSPPTLTTHSDTNTRIHQYVASKCVEFVVLLSRLSIVRARLFVFVCIFAHMPYESESLACIYGDGCASVCVDF